MSHKNLGQYRGELSTSDIAAGMSAARRNAFRLLADAKLLLERGRYASATALAVLSIEESGKCPILRGMSTMESQDAKKEWKDYRSHRSKNTMWILPDLLRTGKRKLHELKDAVDRKGTHTGVLDNLKQVATYTDCLGDKHWSEPQKVIGKALATSVVAIAGCFTNQERVSVREMELWVEHMTTYVDRSDEQSCAALKAWFAAMIAEGLIKETEAEHFQNFIDS